ncbi:MAG: hypothetical protein ACI31C_05770, partial [Muribaculaceae bacterium]
MRYYLRILSVAVMACVAVTAAAWTNPTEVPATPFSGAGTSTDPYRISTAQDLVNFSYICKNAGSSATKDKYYVMTNDIVLNNITSKSDLLDYYESYQQLSINRAKGAFTGNFDGRGHTIRGLIFDGKSDYGFFGYTDNAKISNVTFDYVGLLERDMSEQRMAVLSMNSDNTVFNNVHIDNAYCIAVVDNSQKIHLGGAVYRTDGSVVFNDCSIQIEMLTPLLLGHTGGFVRYNNGDLYINRCKVGGTLQGFFLWSMYSSVGGFVGYNYDNVTINQSVSTVEIKFTDTTRDADELGMGGIVGIHNGESLSINETAFIGKIDVVLSKTSSFAYSGVGGIIGLCEEAADLTHCAVIGEINFSNVYDTYTHHIGYLIGDYADDVCINNCVIVSQSEYASGNSEDDIIDPVLADDTSDVTLENSANILHSVQLNSSPLSSRVTNATYCADLLTNEEYLTTLNAGSSRTIWGKYNNSESTYDGAPLPLACGGVLVARKGAGTSDDPYLIETEADLRSLQEESESSSLTDKYYKLNCNITMSSEPFEAIGRNIDFPFCGHFNGAGYYIQGLVASGGSMFGYMAGTVERLALLDFSAAEGCETVAPIAQMVGASAVLLGTVKNCYVTGDLWAFDGNPTSRCAGICGTVYDSSTLSNCY